MATQQQNSGFSFTPSRVLLFIAFVCALISALIFADIISGASFNDALAWLAGGFASAWLAAAV